MRALLSLVACLALLLLASTVAVADGPVTMRVAHGSVGGQAWALGVGMNGASIVTELSLPMGDGDGGGFVDGPISSHVPLTLDAQATDLGSRGESGLDGYVYETVARLRVQTATGVVTILPHRYPARAVRRWPAIAHVRSFIRFFLPDDQPKRITALDARGHTLTAETIR